MSLPNIVRAGFAGTTLICLTLLAGCSFRPVYSDGASAGVPQLTYAEPASRYEQVAYQTVSGRLGESDDPTAPEFSATVAVRSSTIGLSDVSSPVDDRQTMATITYTVSQNGEVLASGARRATAFYQTNGQLIADDEARAAAEEQAVRAAAEQVRMALIAEFAEQ